MVAAEPGIKYAPLSYKPLEKVKENQLHIHKGNFDHFIKLTMTFVCSHVQWWKDNLQNSFKNVMRKPPQIVLHSDAILKGYVQLIRHQGLKQRASG